MFNLEYSVELFKKETMERFKDHFINIFNVIIRQPDLKLSEIEMITEAEKYRILNEFNSPKTEYPKGKTIQMLFEEQTHKTPDNIALCFEGRKLTYGELNKRANSLGRVLRSRGVKSDYIVGIMMERSFEMIVVLMSILKAGGAYLPISPEYPDERILYMLEDSNTEILLTGRRFISNQGINDWLHKSGNSKSVINIEEESLYRGDSDLENLNSPEDLMYVIYTSGSTGQPKGVMIEHASVVNILTTLQKEYPLREAEAYLLKKHHIP